MVDITGSQGPVATSVLPATRDEATNTQDSPHQSVKPKPKRPNYNQIHAQSLPLTIHPLPPLIPHNPLSWIHIAYVYLRQVLWPPSSFPDPKYIGYFSHETRSVHVTDPRSTKALWEHGFFGKGTLSRSEPTWLDREKRKRGLVLNETSEEWTRKRREERRMFKMERARKEQEVIDETLKKELNATLKPSDMRKPLSQQTPDGHQDLEDVFVKHKGQSSQNGNTVAFSLPGQQTHGSTSDLTTDFDEALTNEEHLQLTLDEALFLSSALGVLTIIHPNKNEPIPHPELLLLFISHFHFPPLQLVPHTPFDPSSPFLISYVAYHHFRSLGWVVRPGVKFAIDYLLYIRGPAFTHAEFAVKVIPAYTDPYWAQKGKKEEQKPWHLVHMVNRVQSRVTKTLVLCYVEVPPPIEGQKVEEVDLEGLLRRYKVREFVVRRWLPNRMRD